MYAGMIVVRSIEEMRAWSRTHRRAGRRVALVPTMGYLHEGHLSLVRIARARADAVAVSLFVNPTQFGPKEDLGRYPRDEERDRRLCEAEGADVLFAPSPETMYPEGYSVYVNEEALSVGLCGSARPGHFRGVTTVVTKLFNIVEPDIAVFGEKDAQQLRVIRRLVRDLDFPVSIVSGPTVREPDGLAMSSRNVMLRADERRQALCINRALKAAAAVVAAGERDAAAVRQAVENELAAASLGRVDYIALVDDDTLEPVVRIERPVLLAVAVRFPSARLIDNAVLMP